MSQTQDQGISHFPGSSSSAASSLSSQSQGQCSSQPPNQLSHLYQHQEQQTPLSHNALLVQEAEAMYKLEMAGYFRSLDDEEKIIEMDMIVRQNMLQNLQSKATNAPVAWESLDMLQKNLSFWFTHALAVFRTSLENERGLEYIRAMICSVAPSYHQKMQRLLDGGEYTDPANLFRLHQHISCELLKFHESQRESNNSSSSLTETQQNEYTAEMLKLFKDYEESNRLKYESKSLAVGIHFGTRNVRVAVCSHGTVSIVNSEYGKSTTPNFVSFDEGGQVVVGEEAEEFFLQDPNHTAIFGIKNIIGKRFEGLNLSKSPKRKLWPFQVIQQEETSPPKIQVKIRQRSQASACGQNNNDQMNSEEIKEYYPEEIFAMILQQVKRTIQLSLHAPIRIAVISVPTHFTDSQRQAVKDAGKIAGIPVVKVINVTTAAVLTYNEATTDQTPMLTSTTNTNTNTNTDQQMDSEDKKNILVFQLGAGELDVALVEKRRGEIKVLASGGDPGVSGQDFDYQLTGFIIDSFKLSHQIDLRQGLDSDDPQEKLLAIKRFMRMTNEVEKQRKILSSASESVVSFSTLGEEFSNLNLDFKITQELVEEINQETFSRCLQLVQRTLDDTKMDKNEIDTVVLAGGSTWIPSLRKRLYTFFGSHREHIFNTGMSYHPENLAVIGAACQACVFRENLNCSSQPAIKIIDVLHHSILAQKRNSNSAQWVELPQNKNILHIPRNFPLPSFGGSRWRVSKGATLQQQQTASSTATLSLHIFEGTKFSGLHLLGDCVVQNIPMAQLSTASDVQEIAASSSSSPSTVVTVTLKVNEEGILNATAACDMNSDLPTLLLKARMSNEEIEKAKVSPKLFLEIS